MGPGTAWFCYLGYKGILGGSKSHVIVVHNVYLGPETPFLCYLVVLIPAIENTMGPGNAWFCYLGVRKAAWVGQRAA
jgi:hypothetical protein